MKKYLAILFVFIVFTSCKKQGTIYPGLMGKWELRHKMGSIIGFDSTYNAGNGRILQFNPDSSYRQYSNGKLLTQGRFHIRITDFPKANSPAVFFDDSSFGEIMILNGTKLQLGMDFDDGIEVDYEKISN
jgi:hypothetical protein